MNNKIPLRRLSEQMSELNNLSVDESQAFVKQLFQLVGDELCSGNEVSIDGLGTFKPMAGVNGDPIKFIVDDKLDASLNAPFSFFDEIVVGDEVDIEELDKIEAPELTAPDPEETTDDQPDEPIAEIPEETVQDKNNQPTDEQNTIEKLEANIPESGNDTPSDSTEETVSSVEDTTGAETSHNEETEQEKTQQIELEETYEDLSSDDDTDGLNIDDQTALEESTVDYAAQMEELENAEASYVPEEEEEFVEYYTQAKSKFWPGFFIGLVVGLIIGALALVAYVTYYGYPTL
ncbi:MAG: hypothetical protein NC230_06765 [Bacteroides sp.]|nr:hypothetical protein [Bacteroides sp.]